jgi:hypothetical protein
MFITAYLCIQGPEGNLKSTKAVSKHQDTFCICIPLIILITYKKNNGINNAGTPSTQQEKCMSLNSAEMKRGEFDITLDLFQRSLADKWYRE